MSFAPSSASVAATPATPAATVAQLRARIHSMQETTLDPQLVPTHPAMASVLPGGGLRQGVAYSVEHSATLLMLLLATASASGSWCAVIGMPEFGAEAARDAGIDLTRLVLVPNPGEQWLAVTAAIADVMSIVVTRPPRRAGDANIARLFARLRQRGATLLVVGRWPQTEAMISVSASRWYGIGDGHGHLSAREVTVTVTSRFAGRPRNAVLWLPDITGEIRAAQTDVDATGQVDATSQRFGQARYGT